MNSPVGALYVLRSVTANQKSIKNYNDTEKSGGIPIKIRTAFMINFLLLTQPKPVYLLQANILTLAVLR